MFWFGLSSSRWCPSRYWPFIDEAIRMAVFERKVKIRMLISCGRDSDPAMFPFLQSLASMDYPLHHISIQIVRQYGDNVSVLYMCDCAVELYFPLIRFFSCCFPSPPYASDNQRYFNTSVFQIITVKGIVNPQQHIKFCRPHLLQLNS